MVYVCDKAFTKEEILKKEGTILQILDFNILSVSSLNFLDIFSKLSNLDEKNYMLSRYLIEMALLDYKMLKYSPSLIASAAIYLVNKIRRI